MANGANSWRPSWRAAPGDVVVRANDGDVGPAFVVRAAPGPDQIGCATRAAAVLLARAYATQMGVDAWTEDRAGATTIVARGRGRVRQVTSRAAVQLGTVAARRAP